MRKYILNIPVWSALFSFVGLAKTTASGPRDSRPDGEKFDSFQAAVAAIDHKVTAASDTYTAASNAALDEGDHAALDSAAATLRASLGAVRPDAAKLKAPEFANIAARDQARRVLAAMLDGIDAN